LVVLSRTAALALKSFDTAAATLVRALCPVVGVESFVTVNVTRVFAAFVPAVSFTVSSEPANAKEQVALPVEGAVTAQALADPEVAFRETPAPDSVITIPAFAPAVIAVEGVNETVATAAEGPVKALTVELSVMASPLSHGMAGIRPALVMSNRTSSFEG
jgi:hypothetical protein